MTFEAPTTPTTPTALTESTAPVTPTAAPRAAAVDHPVLGVPPAAPADAAVHFAASLAFYADVSDVAAALAAGGNPGFVVVDARGTQAWDQGHVPGAIHLPADLIPKLTGELLDREVPVVVHCWGPGCNGATRGALAFARLGYRVKEMIGGYEYWVREGFAVHTADGVRRSPPDPLTAPATGVACAC